MWVDIVLKTTKTTGTFPWVFVVVVVVEGVVGVGGGGGGVGVVVSSYSWYRNSRRGVKLSWDVKFNTDFSVSQRKRGQS